MNSTQGPRTPKASTSRSLTIVTLVAAALLVPLGMFARAGATPSAPSAAQAPQLGGAAAAGDVSAQDVDHRRTEMDLDLVSRTYDAGEDNWTVVAEATLSSNRICLPLVFNCIVGELNAPADASLQDLSCDSTGWNHLLVFRNHCMKQLLFAGHDQKFTFTWSTDPGVSSGTLDLEVEFGRGVLPHTFQQLATAKLSVDLGVSLDVSKSCPTEVGPAEALNCSIVVDYPATPGGGPDINAISVTDEPDAELAALVTGGALGFVSGDGTWNCSALACTDGELANGQSATFEYSATAADDPIGGTGVNDVAVDSSQGPAGADDTVVVLGNGDTRLEIEKTTTDTEANPGGPITWTVKVTNAGPLDALDVVLNDIAPAEVDGLTLIHAEGVGEWDCSGTTCRSASMPLGSATFTAAGTVAADTAGDTSLVNEVGVVWSNDILGPDFPITAGSAVPVVASATTTTTPPSTPSTVPGQGGEPLTIAG